MSLNIDQARAILREWMPSRSPLFGSDIDDWGRTWRMVFSSVGFGQNELSLSIGDSKGGSPFLLTVWASSKDELMGNVGREDGLFPIISPVTLRNSVDLAILTGKLVKAADYR
jgi:hypothetical protein